jgi:mannitol/fructose-specific phosphotransferase system IIA component (Ntr-type)
MSSEDFPDPKSPFHDLTARDRWHAISELMDLLVAQGKISSRNRLEIEKAVVRREMTMSTAVGWGVAIPHTLTELVKEPLAVFGRSKRGINFDAYDRKPVFKVCLFLVPQGQFERHVQFLSNITKLLHRKDL